MTAAHRRGKYREIQAGRALGVARQTRLRFEPKADLEPVVLACGIVLQPEVKTRKRLPKLLTAALEQARRYEPLAIPLAVISEKGGPALAVLSLDAFAFIAGIDPAKAGG